MAYGMAKPSATQTKYIRSITRSRRSPVRSRPNRVRTTRPLRREEPADVRVPEPAHRAEHTRAEAHVRRVRVALDVRVRVVLAVVRHPLRHGALRGHRTEDREHGAHPGERLEALVGEVPVEADRDAEPGDDVQHEQQREIDGRDCDPPPGSRNGDQAEWRERDGDERDDPSRETGRMERLGVLVDRRCGHSNLCSFAGAPRFTASAEPSGARERRCMRWKRSRIAARSRDENRGRRHGSLRSGCGLGPRSPA